MLAAEIIPSILKLSIIVDAETSLKKEKTKKQKITKICESLFMINIHLGFKIQLK